MALRAIYFLFVAFIFAMPHAAYAVERWAAYYADKLPPERFDDYDVLVFDSENHPPLAPLQKKHKIVLGYLSLGEAEDYRSYFPVLEQKKLLLKPNPQWKGHRIIDLRRQAWTDYVLDTLIPAILAQGFNGVMLDTLDSPIDIEDGNPGSYNGMQNAAANLVLAIRARYPSLCIMVNRGFEILPRVGGSINMVMAESLYSDWLPQARKPSLTPASERRKQLAMLHAAQRQYPQLKVYSLDYWPPNDIAGVKRIYALERREGFIPYVSTANLQHLYKEPE